MKYLLNFGLILFFGQIAQSQIDAIDKQMATYNGHLEKAVEEEMADIMPHLKTTCPLILPAIGPVNHSLDIYFDLLQVEPGMGDEGSRQNANIRKVKFKLESGSYTFDYTYYFNDVGMLVFQSERMEDAGFGCTLTSYYFDNNICILKRSELFATDFCEVPEENLPQEKTQLSDGDTIALNHIKESAAKFKELLALYITII
jgi:hypothetical protein